MHSNAQTITEFYDAFGRGDGDAMADCYHRDVTFSDPVFPKLVGGEAGDMWRMLTSRAPDLRIEFSDVDADDTTGRAHWEAWYTFSATGKKVHNIIEARFEFRDGEIIGHRDDFDFWRWSRHALGLPGVVLGWTPLVQNKVRSQAAAQLERWRQRRPQQA